MTFATAIDRRRLAFFAAFALLLLWPAALDRNPLMFFDSPGYYNVGAKVVHIALSAVSPAEGSGVVTIESESGGAINLRSIAYPIFVYLTSPPILGVLGTVIAQAVIAAWMISLLFSGMQLGLPAWGAVFLGMAGATSLPWFASYLMPDVFAGLLVLFALLLVLKAEELGIWTSLALAVIAGLGAASHHSHVPLASALAVTVLGLLFLQKRLTWRAGALAASPVVLALGFNLVASAIAFEAPSTTPKRLPILLARSIGDGPAKKYLEAHCTIERYAICELYPDGFPDSAAGVLFGKTGVTRRATEEQMERIRAEETIILKRVMAEYGLEQAWKVGINGITQVFRFGTADFRWSEIRIDHEEGRAPKLVLADYARDDGRALLQFFGGVQYIGVIASLGLILYYLWRDGLRRGRRNRELVVVLLVGLLANAALCGGLSAPTDRYQARIIWLLPLLAGFFWLERRQDQGAASATVVA